MCMAGECAWQVGMCGRGGMCNVGMHGGGHALQRAMCGGGMHAMHPPTLTL